MDNKQLYNLETGILVILDSKSMTLEVRGIFTQVYYLNKIDFIFVYLLTISHPQIVNYEDFFYTYKIINENIDRQELIDNLATNIRDDFTKYGITDFIIKIKKKGYKISDKWVEPALPGSYSKRQRILKFAKRLLPVFNRN